MITRNTIKRARLARTLDPLSFCAAAESIDSRCTPTEMRKCTNCSLWYCEEHAKGRFNCSACYKGICNRCCISYSDSSSKDPLRVFHVCSLACKLKYSKCEFCREPRADGRFEKCQRCMKQICGMCRNKLVFPSKGLVNYTTLCDKCTDKVYEYAIKEEKTE